MESSRNNLHSTYTTPLSFFKIFHFLNYNRLLIPGYYVKNFNKLVKIPTIFLKDSKGHYWNVKLQKIGNRLAMTKGWKRFVDAHKLEPTDWLLFKYVEDYVFNVQVFGLDGCLKKKEISSNEATFNKLSYRQPKKPRKCVTKTDVIFKEEEDVLDPPKATEDRSVGEKLKFIRVFGQSLHDCMKLPVRVVDGCNIEPTEGTIMRTANGDAMYKVTFKEVKGRIVVGNARMTKFWQLADVYPGDRCRFDVVLGSQRKVKEIILVKVTHNNKYDLLQ